MARTGRHDEETPPAMDGDDHDRLIELGVQVEQLRKSIERDREDVARRLDEYQQAAKALAMAESRGYIDGQIRSILDNVEVIRAAIQTEVQELRETLHGKNGDNGLRSQVWRLKVIIGVLASLVVVLCGAVLGIRLPMII